MAWTWADSRAVQTSTRWYTPATVTGGVPGHPWTGRYVYACLYAYTFCSCGLPVGAPVPENKPRKPLLVLAFMGCAVLIPVQGGVVLFVNPGWCGVGA